MLEIKLWELGRNSVSCAPDEKAENSNLANWCSVNCSNSWIQAIKIPACFLAWTEIPWVAENVPTHAAQITSVWTGYRADSSL